MKIEKNINYEITKSVLFDNDCGFVLGHNPNAVAPYVTWQFAQTQGKRDYFWGHYHGDEARAEGDFKGRIKEYASRYGNHIAELKGVELHKYYSTQRPVDLGTYPKSIQNPLIDFTNYDRRSPVENDSFKAWGELYYLEPLTEKQMEDYELRAAPSSRDKSIAVQLAEGAKSGSQGKCHAHNPGEE